MDASTLAKVMTVEGHKVTYSRLTNRLYFDRDYGGPTFQATTWMAMLNQALVRARCTTAARVEMFLAQLGAESGSFRYTQELASGAEYNGRSDLGNTHPGDGQRYKGRTYIQITGRHNYTALSKWAFSKGYIPTATYFVDHPEKLAQVEYIFLGPVWYWTIARNMNFYADRNDIIGATRAVNGGLNNLSGRTARWNYAKKFGNKLLPTGVKPAPPKHAAPPPTLKPAPKPTPTGQKIYIVQPNDTLSKIASKFSIPGGYQALAKLNGLENPNDIRIGQRLKLNAGASAPAKPAPKPKAMTVIVRSGQTLDSIAKANRVPGGWRTLQKLNNLKNPNLIRVGQKLRVR